MLFRNAKKINTSKSGEEGTVLLISFLVLLLLSVIGLAATNTTSLEYRIVANDRIYKDNFYRAEGSLMYHVQWLEENLGINCTDSVDPNDFDYYWSHANQEDKLSAPGLSNDRVLVVDISEGHSLEADEEYPHTFVFYSMANSTGGETLIQMRYRKVY